MELFKNIKVLELASVLAGPAVGQFFAELGAEVIKIENEKAGGDVTRSWRSPSEQTDDRSAYFCSVNWGKKSVALDLTTAMGKKALLALATRCDIVITSFKPGDAEKLGADYASLKLVNERIIYGDITGYGANDSRVGYDAVIQAESGFMSINGDKEGAPMKMPVALIDILAAHQLKEGLLLALLQRERTGTGSKVEVSLLHTAIASLANQSSNWQVGHVMPTRQGSLHPNIAPYGEMFRTSDGQLLLLAIGNDKQFTELLLVLELKALLTDPRFSTNEKRVANRIALSALIGEAIGQLGSEQLMAEISNRKIPAGLVLDVAQSLQSAQALELSIGGDGLAGTRTFTSMINGLWVTSPGLTPPPHLGQHTSEVFKALSLL